MDIDIEAERAAVAAYATLRAKKKSTLKAYNSDWRKFTAWCEVRSHCALPANPEIVATYVVWSFQREGRNVRSIVRQMPAIAYFHARTYSDRSSPTDDPKVKTVLENLRAEHGIEKRAKDPLLFDDLHTVIGGIDRTTMVGRRDRALLLVAFHAALGRSEIVGLNISDIEDSAGGIRLRVRTAGAEPTYVALTQEDSAEAILALTEWMAILKHADPDDPVFTGTIRSCGRARMIDARYVRVLQARIAAAGIKGDYAGESMVTGCQRWMQSRGVRAVDIIAHTRQKSLDALVKRRPHLRDA